MKKILLICDGGHFPQGAFDFVVEHYKDAGCLLTGIFLSPSQYANLWFYTLDPTGELVTSLMEEDRVLINNNTALFKSLCEKHGIEYRVHEDIDATIFPAIKKESRFADIMLLGAGLFYRNLDSEQPNKYTRTVLHEAECPVLLVPEVYTQPSNIILSYDGSAESVYAIRQFAGLFPTWCALETQLVFVSDKGEDIPEPALIEEYASRHFNRLTITRLAFDPDDFFGLWIKGQQNPLLVTGSFSRTGFSMLLKHSFAKDVMAFDEIPVFVAHK